ncbi:hypothetical protein ACFX13_038152 [Malus domestica]
MTAAVVARNLVIPRDNRLLSKRSDELAVKDSLALSEIRGLKQENKQLHKLAHSYATNMKMKINQMQESDGHILLDHQRFMGLFQQHLPSSSGAVPRNEAPNDQPLAPLLPGVPSSGVASNCQPPAPLISGALLSGEAAPDRP